MYIYTTCRHVHAWLIKRHIHVDYRLDNRSADHHVSSCYDKQLVSALHSRMGGGNFKSFYNKMNVALSTC